MSLSINARPHCNMIEKAFEDRCRYIIKIVKRITGGDIGISQIIQMMLFIFRSWYNRVHIISVCINVCNATRTIFWNTVMQDILASNNQIVHIAKRIPKLTLKESQAQMVRAVLFIEGYTYRCLVAYMLRMGRRELYVQTRKEQRNSAMKIKSYLGDPGQFALIHADKRMMGEMCFSIGRVNRAWNKRPGHGDNLRKRAIARAYEHCIKNVASTSLSYLIYQFTQRLLTISDKQFREELSVKDEEGIERALNFIYQEEIKGPEELDRKAATARNLEWSSIAFNFTAYKIKYVEDQAIIAMLHNIENRLLLVKGFPFVILRRVSDNTINKAKITADNKQEIDQLLSACNDGYLHDVMIISQQKHESIEMIKIRYLNYISLDDSIELTLSHPEDLVSASVSRVNIANMNECIHLRNLCSEGNIYTEEDAKSLVNLKRIHSINDQYKGDGTCLIGCLFDNAKLRYVYVQNTDDDNEVISSMTLSKNLEDLRFISLNQYDATYSIKLDTCNGCLENLRVLEVTMRNGSIDQDSILVGPPEEIKCLKRNLICADSIKQ